MMWRLLIKGSCLLIGILLSILLKGQIVSVSQLDKAIVKTTDRIALYALPQTLLEVRCHISCHRRLVGPYAQYARELLGKEGIQQEIVQWEIDSVTITPVNGFDASQVYVVKYGKKAEYRSLEVLARQGYIIFPLHNKYSAGGPDSMFHAATGNAEWTGVDLPFSTNITDTFYQVVKKDSLLIRHPVIKPRSVTSISQYERAREVVKLIQQIHQRRMDVILAEDDPIPNNEKSIQWMVNQLRLKEEEFLQLFLGKTVTQTYVHSFMYIPFTGKNQPVEIFRFSYQHGISGKNDPSALPVYIMLESTNSITTLRDYQPLFTSFITPVIIYRVPEIAVVSILWGNRALIRLRLPIYQLGALVPLMSIEKVADH